MAAAKGMESLKLLTTKNNAMPPMKLEISIGIRTAFGLTTFIFPAGTPVPTSTRKAFLAFQDHNSGDFFLQLVQGFNFQSILNTYLGELLVQVPETMPKGSDFHLIFNLEASGLTVYAEKDSVELTRLLHIDRNVIFPPTDVVKYHHRNYSMRLDRDKKFVCLTSKKHELADYVKLMTSKLDLVKDSGDRSLLLRWIDVSNAWFEMESKEEEYREMLGREEQLQEMLYREEKLQKILDRVTRNCNEILNPLLYPTLVPEAGLGHFSDVENPLNSRLGEETEDADSEVEDGD